MIGDIVGRPGRRMVQQSLPGLMHEFQTSLVVANAENAAGGFGLTSDTAAELFASGIDALTMGNHVWSKKEIMSLLEQEIRVLRPLNYPDEVPGRGELVTTTEEGAPVGIINVCGTTFMEALDCPFRTTLAAVNRLREHTPVILVDMHAEATSEKMALAAYLDGKVSAVLGTHTHVQTADERVLPGGTAYVTDCGMTGPINSILGIRTSLVLQHFLTHLPERFQVAVGPAMLSGVVVDIDPQTGRATSIQRVQKTETAEAENMQR